MSWLEVAGPGVVAVRSETESGVLAPEVWRITVGLGVARDDASLDTALAAAAAADADLNIVRFASGHDWVVHRLLAGSAVTVPAGSTLYWEFSARADGGRPSHHDHTLRSFAATEGDRCRHLFHQTFGSYSNHYSANPWLRKVDVGAAYADWAARSLQDPLCEVAEWVGPEGAVEALGLTRHVRGVAEILLAGVLPPFRRRGVYPVFLRALTSSALGRGCERVVISTQDHNTAVQRLWAREGFEPVLAVTTVHLVARATKRADQP